VRVLVTGGAGYIGSITTRHLLEQGHDVRVLDSLVHGHREALVDDAELTVADVGDAGALDRVLRGCDAVIHCAGFIEPAESVVRPELYFRNNVAAPLELLEACVRNGCERLVFSSSCSVYGASEALPVTEATPTAPISPYGRTKLMFEQMLEAFGQAHGLQSVSLRYFNAAGAWPDGSLGEAHEPEVHLIPRVLLAIAAGEEVGVYGTDYDTPDGTCVRDYVHVVDLARAHLAAADRRLDDRRSTVINLGTGSGYSVLEVVRTCEEVTGRKARLRLEARRPGDPAQVYASIERARDLLDWTPQRSDLQTIVRDAWSWHRSRTTFGTS